MRCIPPLCLLFALWTLPAGAQQRVVVVPAGAEVAVPARGAVAPAMVRAPRPRLGRGRSAGRGAEAPGGGEILSGQAMGLAVPALIGLPLAAAAAAFVASSNVPGAGSGTSAPARTR